MLAPHARDGSPHASPDSASGAIGRGVRTKSDSQGGSRSHLRLGVGHAYEGAEVLVVSRSARMRAGLLREGVPGGVGACCGFGVVGAW